MIFKKREQWCFRDEKGKLHKFDSEMKAKAAFELSLPLPEVREYDSMDEAIEGED